MGKKQTGEGVNVLDIVWYIGGGVIGVVGVLALVMVFVVVLVLCVRKRGLKRKRKLTFDMIDSESGTPKSGKMNIREELFEIPMDKIDLIKAIGSGGSGSTVYKATWENQSVAFKVFKLMQFVNDDSANFEEFEREVEILGSTSHPSILTFFGASLKPPRVGIIMEFCSNGDLQHYFGFQKEEIADDSAGMAERLRVLMEIASGMSYLHNRKIIHRDLKSVNVLLNEALHAKIMDFGLSKIVEKMSETKTSAIGTSFYMSPEVATGARYTEKCDVFAFGIMLWEVTKRDFKPYGDFSSTEFRIEFKVASDPNFRPKVIDGFEFVDESTREWLIPLMQSCWSANADERKSFVEIFEILTNQSVEVKDQPSDVEEKS